VIQSALGVEIITDGALHSVLGAVGLAPAAPHHPRHVHAPALAEGEGGGGSSAAAAAGPSSARSMEEGVVSEKAAGGRGAVASREHRAEGILAESVTEGVSAAEERSEEVERVRVVM